jgi:hypothetical protein
MCLPCCFSILVFFFLVGSGWADSVYQWVDEKGRLHFSDQKPAGQSAEPVKPLQLNRAKPVTAAEPYRASPPGLKPSKRATKKSSFNSDCQKLQVKLQRVENKLRSGYKEPKGNKLRAQRRELVSAQRKACG